MDSAVHAYIDAHREDFLETLFTLLRQPSISAQDTGVKECAALLRSMLHERDLPAEIITTPTQPIVYAEMIKDPALPTMLCYGHYDVQPPEPLELWASPPFEPTVRNGRIYARGAGDNKGQLITHVLAAEAYLKTAGSLPINVKFVFEGEEESGSESLSAFVAENSDKLACDLVYISDGGLDPSGTPVICLGNRGVLGITLLASGADRDNHSGNKGGIAPNPIWMLVQVLASMVDQDGHVTVDGFYDSVRPVGEAEKALLAELPFDPEAAGKTMGMPPLAVDKETYYRKIMLEPYFNLSGFASGYVGPGSKTIIPAQAECRIDVRMVADQQAEDIFAKIQRHVARVDARVQVLSRGFGIMQPHRTAPGHPAIDALQAAITKARGIRPLIQPASGGSLPSAIWPRTLGVPAINVPYANADENNHSPNENLEVERFFDGIHTSAEVFAALAEATMPDRN